MAAKAKNAEMTEEFIDAWREEKSLWDVLSPLYRNRDAKRRIIDA